MQPPSASPPLPSPLLLAWRAGRRVLGALKRLQLLRQSLRRHSCLLLAGVLWSPQATLNGRLYRRQDIERELAAAGSLLLGAFGHPPPGAPCYATPPPLEEASHQLAWAWEGDHLVGGLRLLNTPAGAQLLHAVLHGTAVGASLRGYARLHPGLGGAVAADDLQLVTIDVVLHPAGRCALAPYSLEGGPGWLRAFTEPVKQ